MLWDTHMHSDFSGDSDSPMESMILAAIEKQLPGICFTDHCDIDYPNNPELFLLDFPTYSESISSFRHKYQDQIKIHYGVELGLQTHLAQKHKEITASHDFDFVIDQDIIVKKEGNMDGDLILKAGTYSYDRSIGQYGGYQFELFKL